MATVGDLMFGQSALEAGLIAEELLRRALFEVDSHVAAGRPADLASLLISRGLITPAQTAQLQSQIVFLTFRCPGCASIWTFGQLAPRSALRCPGCNNALQVASAAAPIAPGPAPEPPIGSSAFINTAAPPAYETPRSGGFQVPWAGEQREASGSRAPMIRAVEGSASARKVIDTTKSVGRRFVGSSGIVREEDGRSFIGDFEILDELGRGAMGVVYKVADAKGRELAIKVLLAGQLASETHLQRFLREAEIASQLEHCFIVPIYEVGALDGNPFFTMEFIEGKPLSRLIRRRKLGIRDSVLVARDIARGLEYAHDRSVIHRDIKPANIIIDDAKQPHVTDFGLARRTDEDRKRLTRTGAVIGTPYYMSPEQIEGRSDIGPATDIYSLGVVLYQMLTFQLPFKAKSHIDLAKAIAEDDPPRPSSLEPAIGRELEAIVLKALAKRPRDRYLSMEDFADDLDAYLEGGAILASEEGDGARLRPALSLLAKIGAVVALLGLGALSSTVLFSSSSPPPVAPPPLPATAVDPGPAPDTPEIKLAKARSRHRQALRSDEARGFREALREARALVDAALTAEPSLVEARLLRGAINIDLFQLDAARADFDAARPHPKALFFLAKLGQSSSSLISAADQDRDLLRAMENLASQVGPSPYIRIGRAFTYALRDKDQDRAISSLEALSNELPDNIDVLLALGYLLANHGRSGEAIEVYKRALRVEPNNFSAVRGRAQTAIQDKDFTVAQANAERMMILNPDAPITYVLQSQIYASRGDRALAIQRLQKYVDSRGDDAGVRLLLAELLTREQRYGLAAEHCEKVRREQPKVPDAYLLLADIYLAQGRPGEHDAVLREGLSADVGAVGEARLFAKLCLAAIRARRWDLLEQHARDRLSSDGRNAQAHAFLGRSLLERRRSKEALTYLERAAELDPTLLEPHSLILEVHKRAGRSEEAEAAGRRMVQGLANNPQAWFLYGELLYRGAKFDEALNAFLRSLNLEPEQVPPRLGAATIRLRQGRHQEVEVLLAPLLRDKKLTRSARGEAFSIMAHSLLVREDYPMANKVARDALKLNPKSGLAHAIIIQILYDAGKIEEATAAAVTAIDRGIDDPDIWYFFGRLQLVQRRPKEACRAFERSLALAQINPAVHVFYAVSLEAAGEKARGEAVLKAARSRFGGNPDFDELVKGIREETGR